MTVGKPAASGLILDLNSERLELLERTVGQPVQLQQW